MCQNRYICRVNDYNMQIGQNLKKLREDKGYTQQQMADLMHTHRTGYSKMENGQQDISVDALVSVATHFGITVDDIINMKNEIPKEVILEDKSNAEQLKLIQELEPEDKSMVFKMIETFLSKKRFKEFVQKNVAM